MPKFKLIVNPISGKGHSLELLPLIEQKLKESGLLYEVVITEKPWHAAELAEQAARDGFDAVVAVGGDGTANEVLNGLMAAKQGGHRATMGVICVGRGNDFAFGARIPTEWEGGCEALAAYRTKRIDVGRVTGGLAPDGRYFGNGVGIGFDAVVGFESQKVRPLTGFAGYLVAALRTIFLYFHAPLVKIQTDEQVVEQNALMVSVMNGRRMGGGFMMAPQGEVDDGKFNVCVAGQVSRLGILQIIPLFMKGTQFGHPAISGYHVRKISVTGLNGGKLPAHADGETINLDGGHLEMEILPGELDVVVGAA